MIVIGIDSGLDGALVALRVPDYRARCLACKHTLIEHEHGGWTCDCAACPWKGQKSSAELIVAEVAPTVQGKTRRLYRLAEMLTLLRGLGPPWHDGVAFACLERGGTRPKEGAAQSWTSGYGFGLWEMALASLGIPYETPTPQQWQKEVYRGIVGEGKERSVLAVDRSLPGMNLLRTPRCKKPHLGLADAAAIALYAARRAP